MPDPRDRREPMVCENEAPAALAAGGAVELGVNHEILHHGQLIVYAPGRAFPAS